MLGDIRLFFRGIGAKLPLFLKQHVTCLHDYKSRMRHPYYMYKECKKCGRHK